MLAMSGKEYRLSQREQEIARCILLEKTNEDICSELFIAQSTLRTHIRNIYGKLNVHNRKEFVAAMKQPYLNEKEITDSTEVVIPGTAASAVDTSVAAVGTATDNNTPQ